MNGPMKPTTHLEGFVERGAYNSAGYALITKTNASPTVGNADFGSRVGMYIKTD